MDHFAYACGATGPLRLQVENIETGAVDVREFDRPFVLIGRDPSVDLPLDDAKVSRRHAYLQVVFGHVFWIDLGSRTGTYRGKESSHSGWLERDQAITIGPYRIRLLAGDQKVNGHGLPADPLASRTEGLGLLPDILLDVTGGPVSRATLPMRTVMALMGSERGCKFRLLNVGVSRFHCGLLRTSAGLFVVDLLGRHGIRVNGSPERSAHLNDGDELQLGSLTVRIRVGSADANPPSSGEVVALTQGFAAASTVAAMPMPASGSMALGSAEVNELAGAIAMSLYNQFGAVQQQVVDELRAQRDQLDEFRDAVVQVDRLLAEEHRERLRLVGEEYDQIQKLTNEIRDLKAWLGIQRPIEPPKMAPPTASMQPPPQQAAPHPPRESGPSTPVGGDFPPFATANGLMPPPHVAIPDEVPFDQLPELPPRPDPEAVQRRVKEILNKRDGLLKKILVRMQGPG